MPATFVIILALFPVCAFSQGTINTFAGSSLVFTGNGYPAIVAELVSPTAAAIDRQGNIFIPDSVLNLVFKVGPDGILNIIAGNGSNGFSGDGGPALNASLSAPSGVAVDVQGNLYIGDSGNFRVRLVTPDGNITTVAGNGQAGFSGDGGSATQASFNNTYSVAVDAKGNLYIADRFNNRIRLVDSTGTISTIVGTGAAGGSGDGGPASQATLSVPSAICLDAAGNLYITDQYSSKVRMVTPNGIITTVAGNGNSSFAGDGAQATFAELYLPAGVVVDGNGNIFISDSGNQRVRMVNPAGIITTVAGTGVPDATGDGGPATEATLAKPLGLAVDPSGNVYIADNENARVRVLSPNATISTLAGTGINVGDGGPATSALLSQPSAVALDSAGNLYIADSGYQRIRQVAPDGTITTVAGNGHRGSAGSGGPATSANLASPQGVAIGPQGQIYITDDANSLIRVVDTISGDISVFAGSGSVYGDGGPATSAQILTPSSIAADAAGNVYFDDNVAVAGVTQGVVVRRVGPDGNITTAAGTGDAGYSGDGGPAIEAQLGSVIAVGLDASGNLLIADTNNNAVRRVDSNGIITTIAATADPWGVTSDAAGNIYISNAQSVIRKLAPDGTISTYAGGHYGFSGDGGLATAAALESPKGMVVDAAGNLYIADINNNRVRVVTPQ